MGIITICEVHDDAQLAPLGLVDFFEPDDVRVIEDFQYFRFSERLPFLVLTHLRNVNFLYHSEGLD
jgi:hypothetical protein